ncbi:site-specific DNA-methyltransferase [Euryarchaeota archaeon]|jgi:DNA modification methylase|nr:site-specific DNA-methyltransferase [Euryarchaeota archaeon]
MTGTEWSRKKFCHTGDSPKMLAKKIPDGLRVKLFLTDPPYNIGHKYGDVNDRRPKAEYLKLMENVLKAAYDAADDSAHFFMIHYPEAIAEMWPILTEKTGWEFHQWITWTYPSNIGMSNKSWTRASRTIIWLQKREGGNPTFHPKRIVRPYRNPWDKRVAELIKSGKRGCSLYDWWQINLVKNVNVEKSDYSNQIPQVLLERIIRSTTDVGDLVADPFSGTYSTMKAALGTGRLGWGCDLNKETKQYWPDKEVYNPEYVEEEYSIDQPEDFDIVRAGMTREQLNNLIRRACENGFLSEVRAKWTMNELEFIEQTSHSEHQ